MQNTADVIFYMGDVVFKMVFVRGGTFRMGGGIFDNEEPLHNVALTDFYIGEFEVTQELWESVMKTDIRQQRDKASLYHVTYGTGMHYPMCFVNHDEVVDFCIRINGLLGSHLPTGYGFWLPTEAQWEYAARGGNSSKSYIYAGSNKIEEVAFYSDNSNGIIHEVGCKVPNELGLYDMSGNVWEWCWDKYDSKYYRISPLQDPQGPVVGGFRVLRGGGWYGLDMSCRINSRCYDSPHIRSPHIGFRLALTQKKFFDEFKF